MGEEDEGTIVQGPWSGEAHEPTNPPKEDIINNPQHYVQNGIETINIIEHVISCYPHPTVTFAIGSCLKYICRAPLKGNSLDDLRKARWFLDRAIWLTERIK